VTGPGSYRLQTLEGEDAATRGTPTNSVDFTPSLSTTLRPLRCKRPPGPGTSLRTTLLQDLALTATNGSWVAQSVKGL
jgi:hypothetical protein